MCHAPLFFGLLFGAFIARRLFARRFGHRFHGFGGLGGGPHGRAHFMRHGGAVPPGSGPGGSSWRGFGDDGSGWGRPVADPARLDRALSALDLSDRQKQEVDEALLPLRESVAGDLVRLDVPALLAAVAAADFDAARAQASLPHVSGGLRKSVTDGLEHFHNVLTAEQREQLARHAAD